MFYPRSEGPPSGGVPEGGARPAFPRLRPQRSLGRCGNPLVGHYDLAARSIAARCPGGNARARKRGTASENRRWSAERRASLIAKGRGRLARARHVLAPRARGPRKPPRLSALRRPSSGGGKEKQNPGAATRRGNEETTLFDTVNRNARPPGCNAHRGTKAFAVGCAHKRVSRVSSTRYGCGQRARSLQRVRGSTVRTMTTAVVVVRHGCCSVRVERPEILDRTLSASKTRMKRAYGAPYGAARGGTVRAHAWDTLNSASTTVLSCCPAVPGV